MGGEGPTGPTGPDGAKGDTGPPGPSNLNCEPITDVSFIDFCKDIQIKGSVVSAPNINIGKFAGETGSYSQGNLGTIAIGNEAGRVDQSANAIAIGTYAAPKEQHEQTIVINASDLSLNSDGSGRCFIAPIRENATNSIVYYNTSTKELTHGNSDSFDVSFNYYFVNKPWPPVYVNGGSFTPPYSYNRGIFDASSGKFDINDVRLELDWILPPRKAAAFAFKVKPESLVDESINLTNSGAPRPEQEINDICLNYLPYHESLHIDYRTRNNLDLNDISEWTTITPDILALDGVNVGGQIVRPNLYAQTRGAHFIVPQTLPDASGIYGPDAAHPQVAKFVYENSGFIPMDDEKSYQFRIYLKNHSEEILYSPDYWGQIDPSWNYLYIPDTSDVFIAVASFGDPTAPNSISIIASTYRTFNISGANDNSISGNTAIAEIGLSTQFGNLQLNGLYVNYGFDLSGSSHSSSKQFTKPPAPYNDISLSYISNNIRTNHWTTSDLNIVDLSVNYTSNDNNIVFPGFQYDISGYFMDINVPNTEASFANLATLQSSNRSIIVSPPSRSEVTSVYTDYIGNGNNNTFLTTTDFVKISGSDFLLSTAYRRTGDYTGGGNTNTPINNIYFFSEDSLYNLENNSITDYKVKLGPDGVLGTDFGPAISGQHSGVYHLTGIDNISMQVQELGTIFLNGDPRKGWVGNDSPQHASNSYFEFKQSGTKEVYPSTVSGSELYRRRGWYLGLDISSVKIKDIQLSVYPDICNNNYNSWNIKLLQKSVVSPYPVRGELNLPLLIAKKPDTDVVESSSDNINPNISLNSLSVDFFGLGRPQNSTVFELTLNGSITGMNPHWRPSLVLMTSQLLYMGAQPSPGAPIQGDTVASSTLNWDSSGGSTQTISEIASNTGNEAGRKLALPLNYITTNNYSRDRSIVPQFSVTSQINNNIGRTPAQHNLINNVNFNGSPLSLWWDYTYSSFNMLSSLYEVGTAEYPSNITSTYLHSNVLGDNELMWCKNGFTSGNYTQNASENPYIDYTIYYGQSRNYALKNSTGTYKSLSYTATDDDYYAGGNKSFTANYKWIMLRSIRVSTTSFGRVVVTGTSGGGASSTLTLGDDYLLYYQEVDTFFDPATGTIPSTLTAGRSGWKAAHSTFDAGLTVQNNNSNEAGGYRRRTNAGVVATYNIKFFSPNSNTPIFYRIGLANNSNIKITAVNVDYGLD